jgi:UDP-N-acetyl-D-mannosaminuronic acid dehydrogenase
MEHKVFKLTTTQEAVDNSDIIVYLVAHNEFKNIITSDDKIILDFCGINN